MTPTMTRLNRCVRCNRFARLDRAGYCPVCAAQDAGVEPVDDEAVECPKRFMKIIEEFEEAA